MKPKIGRPPTPKERLQLKEKYRSIIMAYNRKWSPEYNQSFNNRQLAIEVNWMDWGNTKYDIYSLRNILQELANEGLLDPKSDGYHVKVKEPSRVSLVFSTLAETCAKLAQKYYYLK